MIPIDAEFHKEAVPHAPRAPNFAEKAGNCEKQESYKVIIRRPLKRRRVRAMCAEMMHRRSHFVFVVEVDVIFNVRVVSGRVNDTSSKSF